MRRIWWGCIFCNTAGFFQWGLRMHLRQHEREVIHEAEGYAKLTPVCTLCHSLSGLIHRPCFNYRCFCNCHRGLTPPAPA